MKLKLREVTASEAFDNGYNAYLAGIQITENPFDAETQIELFSAWIDGCLAFVLDFVTEKPNMCACLTQEVS